MDPVQTATASAAAIGALGSHFMLDAATYATGAELGFEGMTFYVAGRGGALGDVHADVVAAAFVFFNPATVAEGWDATRATMGRREAAEAFAGCAHRWAEAHLPTSVDAAALAALAGTVIAAADPAGAPLFAAWRAMPEPAGDAALALHRMNVLRELRGGLHGCAVLATGLSPRNAVEVRTPFMAPLFGWPEAGDATAHRDQWEAAEAATNAAMGRAFAALGEAERRRFVELADAAEAGRT
jgi:hypothetical protein